MTSKQLDKVLNWINSQRKKHELGPPLAALPKGTRAACSSCPIAKGLLPDGGGKVCSLYLQSKVTVYGRHHVVVLVHPQYIGKFINAFDDGLIPELNIRKRKRSV